MASNAYSIDTAENVYFGSSIEEFKQNVNEANYANRYVAVLNLKNSANNEFGNDLKYLIKSISLPTMSYNAKQLYIGGVNTAIPNLFEQGQLDMTIYNVNFAWRSFYKWGMRHYDQNTRCYGYLQDYQGILKVYEYFVNGNLFGVHYFDNVTLYNLGNIQLAYDDVSELETFTATLQYRRYNFAQNNKYGTAGSANTRNPVKIIGMEKFPADLTKVTQDDD